MTDENTIPRRLWEAVKVWLSMTFWLSLLLYCLWGMLAILSVHFSTTVLHFYSEHVTVQKVLVWGCCFCVGFAGVFTFPEAIATYREARNKTRYP
jgi:hypothetical protein